MFKKKLNKICQNCNVCSQESSIKKFRDRNLRLSLKNMQKKVIIRSGDLGVSLSEFGRQVVDKNSWKTSLAVLITLFVARVTTDFKEISFLSHTFDKNQVSSVFWCFLIFGMLWFIKDLKDWYTNRDAIVDLLNLIQEDSINKPDYTAVFIATKKIDNEDTLLVNYKKSWNSYFLPYVKRSEHFKFRNLDDYSCYIKNKLNFHNAQVFEINFPVKESEKYDVPENIVKEFHFQFIRLNLNDESLPEGYEWKSISDLVHHENTMKYNNDIISTIISHRSKLLNISSESGG